MLSTSIGGIDYKNAYIIRLLVRIYVGRSAREPSKTMKTKCNPFGTAPLYAVNFCAKRPGPCECQRQNDYVLSAVDFSGTGNAGPINDLRVAYAFRPRRRQTQRRARDGAASRRQTLDGNI